MSERHLSWKGRTYRSIGIDGHRNFPPSVILASILSTEGDCRAALFTLSLSGDIPRRGVFQAMQRVMRLSSRPDQGVISALPKLLRGFYPSWPSRPAPISEKRDDASNDERQPHERATNPGKILICNPRRGMSTTAISREIPLQQENPRSSAGINPSLTTSAPGKAYVASA